MSSNLPISSPYRSTPDAPVTAKERDQLSSRLNAAFSEGTIDSDDYQARLDQLFAAQKLGQLVPVVDGLPPLQTYENPAMITSGGQPGQLTEARNGAKFSVAVVGGVAGALVLIVLLLLLLL